MNDRELLEMAAKAAGYSGAWIKWLGACNPLDTELGFFHGSDGSVWSPLTNDGDALRLAVRLKMTIRNFGHLVSVMAPHQYQVDKYTNDDPCAATRRAIVRAAAEIGRAMP